MSRQAKHGPSPWRKQSGVTYISVIDANEHPILFNASPEQGVPREEHESNADLIAAAPEMLAALELVSRLDEAMLTTPAQAVVAKCRVAIAKAKGGK